jgi:hypothetical protein
MMVGCGVRCMHLCCFPSFDWFFGPLPLIDHCFFPSCFTCIPSPPLPSPIHTRTPPHPP